MTFMHTCHKPRPLQISTVTRNICHDRHACHPSRPSQLSRVTCVTLAIIATFTISLSSCSDIDHVSLSPNHRLMFSCDTLAFDTIFSSVGSTTKHFLAYNPNNEALKIESIALASGGKSGFRFNVDGRKGESFQGIDIWKKDSLYIAVEITIDPNGANQPMVIEDSMLFLTNGVRQYVLLQAYGQDIHLIKGGVVYDKDTTLTADLPYLVYDSLVIAEGATVTISEGAIFYMHHKANLIVAGTIKAKGTQEKPVIFRGDRLDYIPTVELKLYYDLIPGQWGGIYFNATSYENEFDHVIVRNGFSGLTFRESGTERLKMQINNSQITNMDSTLFTAVNCRIEAVNSEFSNSSESTVIVNGGHYQFTHCTLVNYKKIGKAREINSASLKFVLQWEAAYPILQQAYFDNCIVDGGFSEELMISATSLQDGATIFDKTLDVRFTSCFLKYPPIDSENVVNCLFEKSPTYLKYGTLEDKYVFDYRLANESAGIGAADRTIAEKYPVDRYGVNRLTSPDGPSIGAYEYIYQEDKDE